MISMTGASSVVRATSGAVVVLGAWAICRADVTLPNTPAAYRLQNAAAADPRTAGCGRCEPLPPYNRGCWLNNPRGTGVDDPWRPPKVWPQTRYPVVPAYTRPSFGFYETSWRVLSVCGTSPWTRIPPAPVPPREPAPTQRPATTAPAGSPSGSGPPRAVPPKAVPPQLPRTNEALPAPNVPPANVPRAGQQDFPPEFPTRSASAVPDEFNSATIVNPDAGLPAAIAVHAF